MSDSLKKTIDRMVEQSIRRILPSVMNEVLVATIARGIPQEISESAPKKPPRPKKQRQPKEQAPQRKPKRPVKDLSEILSRDDSVGADFYSRGLHEEVEREPEPKMPQPELARRIEGLPPELRGMAEGMSIDEDEGESWDDESMAIAPAASEIRNVNEAAQRAGIDFSRMKAVIGRTAPAKRVDSEDAKAAAQFEQARINRMRQQLNGGKPIE